MFDTAGRVIQHKLGPQRLLVVKNFVPMTETKAALAGLRFCRLSTSIYDHEQTLLRS